VFLFVVGPFLTIFLFNLTFGTGIELTWMNWLLVMVIGLISLIVLAALTGGFQVLLRRIR